MVIVTKLILAAILGLKWLLPALILFIVVSLIFSAVSRSLLKDAFISSLIILGGYIVAIAAVIVSAFMVSIFA